jgi:serine/threonine protein kinase
MHSIYQVQADAPYDTLEHLGGGSSGSVYRVQLRGTNEHFARKSIKIPPAGRTQRQQTIDKIKEEARIIRRLRNNPHIVEVVSTYEIKTGFSPTFCILLLPVADCDLGSMLEQVDQMSEDDEKRDAIRTMRHWAACLIRATDYMHYNHVKHKDIKPTNILVRGDEIYITDFGIAKDFLPDASSASTAWQVDGTRRYCPPEALNQERRGRASDVFSLGCCLLELATVMITCGQLATLKQAIGRSYGESEESVLRWIYYLFNGLAYRSLRRHNTEDTAHPSTSIDSVVLQHAFMLPALAFTMMDTTASKRITARQLVTLVSVWAKDMYCKKCRLGAPDEDPTLGLHSKFKSRREMEYPEHPENVLEPAFVVPHNWEEAKELWLKDHMWWS